MTYDALRDTKFPLVNGAGEIPAAGFGTLFKDPAVTTKAVKDALEVGFRHIDCAERYQNEDKVGVAIQEVLKAGKVRREDIFITTKLWNTNHRPERVGPAFEAKPPTSSNGSYRLLSNAYALCLSTRRKPDSKRRTG